MTVNYSSRPFSAWLIFLLTLFVFRVAAQLLQTVHPVTFLPPFDAWQSGTLPYPLLLLAQLMIIALCLRMIIKVRTDTLRVNRKTGLVWLIPGFIYLFVMLFRLTAGLSFAVEHSWLGALIPTIFHLVLASFIISVGLYYWRIDQHLIRWIAYPSIMLSAQIICMVYAYRGANLSLATFIPVIAAALAITLLERTYPYRKTWHADRNNVTQDTIYMLLVQILLPRLLSFSIVFMILGTMSQQSTPATHLWPHHWPVYGQMLLMLLSAEFMRYWVHRLAHNWTPLWRLHAVHHSPHKLYWLNVGRFHPLEKGIQFLFDAMPFLVFGVSQEVLALYFVFYAVNGFFQHCNIDVRLGWLNYIISGPELHRWHHSKFPKESNHNYGNNLIVWDLLFGTWFLPREKRVGDLGLLNRNYPMRFVEQIKSPFVRGLDSFQ
ncbi:MAG: hypothetical protein DHS20C01_30860 [marine bacterium B5-7]|nr:MAG: hypothetical protein DHS20C01_30860 [marine bacterium B5-7]